MTQLLMTFSTSSLKEEDPNLNPSNFTVRFSPPIKLGSRAYRVAFQSFFGWNSYHNVIGKTIVYNINGSPFTLTVPDGLYSVEDVNTLLQTDIVANGGDADELTLLPNYNTNKVECTILNTSDTYTLDFSAANNMASFFGFPEAIIVGSSTAPEIANVNSDTENLNVECDLVEGSYKDGRFSRIIHSFVPAGPTNSSLQIFPLHRTWNQVNKTTIDRIGFKVTDNNGNVVDFQGEDCTIQIVLEEI